jgi:hypothetical protein
MSADEIEYRNVPERRERIVAIGPREEKMWSNSGGRFRSESNVSRCYPRSKILEVISEPGMELAPERAWPG